MTTSGVPPGFDAALWKDARWSRWSFRNTREFLPVAEVSPSRRPRPLPTGETQEPAGFARFLAGTHATSAILIVDGGIVADWPAGAATDPLPHMLFSVTKSVVGLVARILVSSGAVNDLREAGRYLPVLAGTAFGASTVADLLAMRDGIPFDETYADPGAAIHAYSRAYWGNVPGGALGRLAALPRAEPRPGFAYRTPVADVVGAVLAAATGCPLSVLVEELLWRPMGAAHAAYFVVDTAGVEIAGAGLNAATSDLVRLALLLLDGGERESRQVIPRDAVEGLFRGGDRASFGAGYPGRPGWSYRDLWWHMGGGRIAALGVHGQRLIIDRERRFALVRTGAQPTPDNRPFDEAHSGLLAVIGSGRPDATPTPGRR